MEGYGPSGEALVRIAEGGARADRHRRLRRPGVRGARPWRKAAGVDVIVVDHHKCASALPDGFAIVNPNRLDESDGGAAHGHLAAVGMAFLLGAALLRTLRGRGFFAGREEPKLIDLLDLVALGTVADVAQLRGPQPRLRHPGAQGDGGAPQYRPRRARRRRAARPARPNCRDLGFALGPADQRRRPGRQVRSRRAAADHRGSGRGARRSPPSSTGSTRSAGRSRPRSARRPRRCAAAQGNRAVAMVAAPGWHPGVIGIVAGRLKEKLHRPAIVIALGEDGIGKGSGRSISGVDLGAAVLAAKDSGLLVAGGGHAMAAGLTVAARRDRGARRLPRRAARRRRRAEPRRPRAAARRPARAGRGLRRPCATRSRRAGPMAPAGRRRASPPGRSASSRRTWSATAICA